MQIFKIKKTLPLLALLAVFTAPSFDAKAQTANMTADVTVQNTLTLTTPSQLNFGTVVAVRDAAETARVTIDTAGSATIATTGGTAVTAIVDDTLASAGQVTVADGATLNIVINNVVDPIAASESFVLDDFTTSWNGGAEESQTIGSSFTETYDLAFGSGVNTLDIGAAIITSLGTTPYTDADYAGTYDVVLSY